LLAAVFARGPGKEGLEVECPQGINRAFPGAFCYGSSHNIPLNPARKERMNGRLLVVGVLVLCGLSLSPVAAPQTSPQKKPKVVKQEPVGEYERCEENCPPPGLSAQPSEVWCATRGQCTSQSGCGCRLFKRQRGTASFEYVAEAEMRVPREPGAAYVCWCTKKKGP
jgi:hypothetical protein